MVIPWYRVFIACRNHNLLLDDPQHSTAVHTLWSAGQYGHLDTTMAISIDTLPGKEIFTETYVPNSIWKLICIILIIINIKNVPLVWHVSSMSSCTRSNWLTNVCQIRLLNAFRHVLRSERSRVPMTPAQLFQPLITESHGSIMELDYNIHSKSHGYPHAMNSS